MKKFIIASIAALVFLTGCGEPSQLESSKAVSSASLAGTWTGDEPPMVAHIVNNKIQIDIVDEESASLYWVGTFDPSTTDGNQVSQGNTEAMDSALLGSQDSTKQFQYKDGKLSFKFSMMGTTRTVNLVRKES